MFAVVFLGRMYLKWLLKMVGKQISTPRVFLNPESEVEYVESCFCPKQMGHWPNPKLPHPAGLQGQTWLGQWRNEEKIHRKARTGWSRFLDGNAAAPCKLRVVLIHNWAERWGHCRQLNKESGLMVYLWTGGEFS